MSNTPQSQDKSSNVSSVRNGQIKDKPIIVKTSVLPPPSTKPKK
jgi:hypothetical protein